MDNAALGRAGVACDLCSPAFLAARLHLHAGLLEHDRAPGVLPAAGPCAPGSAHPTGDRQGRPDHLHLRSYSPGAEGAPPRRRRAHGGLPARRQRGLPALRPGAVRRLRACTLRHRGPLLPVLRALGAAQEHCQHRTRLRPLPRRIAARPQAGIYRRAHLGRRTNQLEDVRAFARFRAESPHDLKPMH